jgi:cobalt/nickel transport system permease protein
VIAYLQRTNLPVLRINHPGRPETDAELAPTGRSGWRWGLIGLAAMVVLTPLGLIAPGGAFGEAAPDDLDLNKYHLDAVPSGLRHYAGFWHNALFHGYDFTNDRHPVIGYLVSAAVGMAAVAAVVVVAFAVVRRLRRTRAQPDDDLDAVTV